MNRDEALQEVAKWDWLSCDEFEIVDPEYSDDWRWTILNGDTILTHSIHDPITRADWQDARNGIVISTPTVEPDMVNHPPHYQSDNGVECIDAIRAALGRDGFIAYCRGNAIKYLWRDKVNNVEDRNKAAWYINRANAEEQSCQQ